MIHCLHGAVGSHRDWELFKDSFNQDTKAVDLWKLFENASPTLPEAGQIIADQAAQNDILLGYSMGGRLALHALLADPKKWQAAIIISAHPGLLEGHPERLANDKSWSRLPDKNWEFFLSRWNKQNILSTPPAGLKQAEFQDRAAVAESFHHWSLGTQENLRLHFSEITCPVLWITGENDPKFTKLAEEALSYLPNARHHATAHSGHRVPWETPRSFLEIVNNFLKNLPY
ncbi:MAG: 2-succinyl-6-hydroxy-2,4-cyclohexadiene-1-carboxylate synthase [Paracoccaceae bacterium]|jgi:2-succinyl-6-hydroxy-2,4-cyclohexadiene-1-carboxylate synthase